MLHGTEVSCRTAHRAHETAHGLKLLVGIILCQSEVEGLRHLSCPPGLLVCILLRQVYARNTLKRDVEQAQFVGDRSKAFGVFRKVHYINCHVLAQPHCRGLQLCSLGTQGSAKLVALTHLRMLQRLQAHSLRHRRHVPRGGSVLTIPPAKRPESLVAAQLLRPLPAKVLTLPIRHLAGWRKRRASIPHVLRQQKRPGHGPRWAPRKCHKRGIAKGWRPRLLLPLTSSSSSRSASSLLPVASIPMFAAGLQHFFTAPFKSHEAQSGEAERRCSR
mmetsp:Transcript_124540/g.265542  ORF Transcript_124540/g.265542 Transcript_124540/m.265542 type:complete len:274 (+) Transcript_124540:1181-2002(+)